MRSRSRDSFRTLIGVLEREAARLTEVQRQNAQARFPEMLARFHGAHRSFIAKLGQIAAEIED